MIQILFGILMALKLFLLIPPQRQMMLLGILLGSLRIKHSFARNDQGIPISKLMCMVVVQGDVLDYL